eukprot:158241-Rhodomonas_salina.1
MSAKWRRHVVVVDVGRGNGALTWGGRGQGDMERANGMDVTPMCDRTTQSRVALQKGFIDFVIGVRSSSSSSACACSCSECSDCSASCFSSCCSACPPRAPRLAPLAARVLPWLARVLRRGSATGQSAAGWE